ncbi:MAG: glycosyltransferase [Promethearchaeota archaeon]|jgi:glycosyltransferase involved in cell wall biosynthesis
MPEVSIVIPTYNEAENVERLVRSVSKLEVDAEII